MEFITARCMMCGKTYQLNEEHKDFKKLNEKKQAELSFICDMCSNKVRFESEEQRKPKKPVSSS